ncbi:AAA family ATPase [Rhizobium leguminosarum]|uniref:AAA family ATPase n=1 Tax=Rhizobium leguminosarum TaxID=384 RepID=A0A7M3DWC8_RHILE|nr:AAA family ATPase [Rhizobium leguminosarum]TAY52977.1 hypothetical protein ELH90_15750 [Rhizobium leguminosarum]
MIDESLFWSLPGPRSFVDEVVRKAESNGVVAVQAPSYRPPGMMEAISGALESEGLAPAYQVRSQTVSSIVHRLAFAAGLYRQQIRSVSALVDSQAIRGAAFVVTDIDPKEWSNWLTFFRAFVMERRRRVSAPLLPAVVAFVPTDCPPADLERLFGNSIVQWRGRVSSFDIRSYVIGRTAPDHRDSLMTRIAIQLVVGIAGYDPRLAEWLCKLTPHSLVDSWDLLRREYGTVAGVHPQWGNGLVDLVDGEVFVHTSSYIAGNSRREFDVRRWRAVSGPVLDFNATVCRYFTDLYASILESRLPYVAQTPMGTQTVVHRYDLENKHIRLCLQDVLEDGQRTFLSSTNYARNSIAHNEVPDARLLQNITDKWEQLAPSVRRQDAGWNWPRCGQRLVMLVGPTGAGKSKFAAENFAPEEVISSDAVRIELFGTLDNHGAQSKVFEVVEERLVDRLARGLSAVLDATNIKGKDRLHFVDLMPPDMAVEYVVIDRPVDEKKRDGQWRNHKPGLIDGHTRIFESELAAILDGDGRDNVTVVDNRDKASVAQAAAE